MCFVIDWGSSIFRTPSGLALGLLLGRLGPRKLGIRIGHSSKTLLPLPPTRLQDRSLRSKITNTVLHEVSQKLTKKENTIIIVTWYSSAQIRKLIPPAEGKADNEERDTIAYVYALCSSLVAFAQLDVCQALQHEGKKKNISKHQEAQNQPREAPRCSE